MNGDINRSTDLELTVTDSLNNQKLNGNSYSLETNNKSTYESFNCNNNCDNHQINSLNGVAENGNGYVPIQPRKQHSYNLNNDQKPKRCSSCATKICIFCTGFIIGLLLSIVLLSALQYFNDKSSKKYYNASRNESLVRIDNNLNRTQDVMKHRLEPSGRSMKNFTLSNESEITGNPIDNYINKSFTMKTSSNFSSLKTTTLEPNINDSHQTQGQDQGFNDVDGRTPYIQTFPDNYTFNSNLSGFDMKVITIEPEINAGRVQFKDNNNNISDTNNYNEINKLFINSSSDGNEAINDLTSSSTASTIDSNEGKSFTTLEAINITNGYVVFINNNDSLTTQIPEYEEKNASLIEKVFDVSSDTTTELTINNSSENTENLSGTDLVQELQTPTETNDLTPTRKSIELLLTESKLMPNKTDSVFSSTTLENMITTTSFSITNDVSPTTISSTQLSSGENIDHKKPNLSDDPFIAEDVTTDANIQINNFNITDSLNTSEPVFDDKSTPSLLPTEDVTEANPSLSSSTISYITNATDLSLTTTESDLFNDTLYLNNSETTPEPDINLDFQNNDTLLLLNQNKTFNDTILQNSDFNTTESPDLNNTLESDLNSTSILNSDPILLSETNGTIPMQLENSTEPMPTILNISSSIPPEVYCLSTQFSCPNESHRCLDNDLICDGVIDCSLDGFDERECDATNCSANFKCSRSLDFNSTHVKCIPRQSYCDGIYDCEDGSDELGCHLQQCLNGEFLCKDGTACIKGKQACDGTYNCPDHSDEINCVSRTSCETMGRFYCEDGLCIERSLRCDGIPDCRNGTDEQNCVSRANCSSNGRFFCDNGNCIERSKRCDGVNDCIDSSDEYECVRNDEKGVVQVYDSSTDSWSILCAKSDFETSDADRICHRFGYLRSTNYTLLNVRPLNTSWVDEILETGDQFGPIHSTDCDTNQTVAVFCDNFKCGLNRRGQDTNSTDLKSSEDVPIGLTIVGNVGHECPAQIIASKWLITSAQCIKNFSTELTKIKSNENILNIKISKIQIHSHYSKFRSLRFSDYDIALVETNQILNISEQNTVCLPAHQIDPEITCFVGTPFGDDIPYQVIEKQVCNSSKHFNTSLTSRHFCANINTQQSITSVNSKRCVPNASPLICLSSSSHWYIAGFVSYEHGCNGSHFMGHLSHPTVFSNVYSMKSFIEKAIGVNQYLVKTDYPLYSDNYDFNFETTISSVPMDVMNTTSIINFETNISSIPEDVMNTTSIFNFETTVSSVPTDVMNTTSIINFETNISSIPEDVLNTTSIFNFETTISSIPIDVINNNSTNNENSNETIDSNFTETTVQNESPNITKNLSTTENPIISKILNLEEDSNITTDFNTTENLITTEIPNISDSLFLNENTNDSSVQMITTPDLSSEKLITSSIPSIDKTSDAVTKLLKSSVEYEDEKESELTTIPSIEETEYTTDSIVDSNNTET